MRKMMKKLAGQKQKADERLNDMVFSGYGTLGRLKRKAGAVMSQQSGEGFVDSALKILISVVIGALLLAGLYALFNDNILPTLSNRVKELFDYKG